MTASASLQAAAIAALREAPGLSGGVYDGPPLQAAFPYAVVECGPESEWGHKTGAGRELRLAVLLRDKGERPARLYASTGAAETALEAFAAIAEPEGWQLVTLRPVRSRTVREPGGTWLGVIEYRARMLARES
jgi:hypothetical protein